MATVTLPTPIWLGPIFTSENSAVPASLLLDATGEKVVYIIQATQATAIDKFEFLLSAFSQCTNGLRCSIKDVSDTTGAEGSTEHAFRVVTPTGAGWVAPGLMTSDGTDTGTKYTPAVGEQLALVITWESFAASNSVTVGAMAAVDRWPMSRGRPYILLNGARTNGSLPNVTLKHASGTTYPYIPGCFPFTSATGGASYGNAASPDERGLRFKVPFPTRIVGCWVGGNIANDAKFVFSDGSTDTELLVYDGELQGFSGANRDGYYHFTTPMEIDANTEYYLFVVANEVGGIFQHQFTVESNAMLDAWDCGKEWYLATRTNGASLATDDTTRPAMGLLIDQLDDGTSVGGSGGGTRVIGG